MLREVTSVLVQAEPSDRPEGAREVRRGPVAEAERDRGDRELRPAEQLCHLLAAEELAHAAEVSPFALYTALKGSDAQAEGASNAANGDGPAAQLNADLLRDGAIVRSAPIGVRPKLVLAGALFWDRAGVERNRAMHRPATHFPPAPTKLSRAVPAGTPPVVSIAALAGVSAWVRQSYGDRVLEQANRAAMLDIEAIEDQDCFIPHATMTGFLAEIERRSGERDVGLLIAPHLSLSRYGCWGAYVLGGDTLGEAIERAMATIAYHSRGDRMELAVARGSARVRYHNAAGGRPGYVHVATGTVGVLVSLFRSYLPTDWIPRSIEIDVPEPRHAAAFEDVFACPVVFGAPAVAIRFDASLLNYRSTRRVEPRPVTLGDLARSRLQPASLGTFRGVVVAQIWAQVLAGGVSIDSTALALGVSVRTLQRTLHRELTDFRELANAVRLQRAKELLAETPASITEISNLLGYSAPANFARAFRKSTGTTPQNYRITGPAPRETATETRTPRA